MDLIKFDIGEFYENSLGDVSFNVERINHCDGSVGDLYMLVFK
jgi:hypothetical protein